MKEIKVRFEGFWPGFDPQTFAICQILRKHYDVVISEDPDYVICSLFSHHPYVDSPQVRIFFSGENFIPDMNLVDYAVSVYPMELLDRHFSLPGLVDRLDHFYELQSKNRDYPASILEEKPFFANFIASHNSENGVRKELFELLSQYKRIESPGSFLYNMPNGEKVRREDGTKRLLQSKCKFTLCCESTCEGGFITEKIIEAFCADTIPVYYGSSTVADVFNKDAFINIADYDSLEAVVERIVELDRDDDKYLDMLRQPVFAREGYVQQKLDALEAFLCHIFDQPLAQARRRPRAYTPKAFQRIVSEGRVVYLRKREEEKRAAAKKRKREDFVNGIKVRLYQMGCKLLGEERVVRLRRSIKG